MTIFTCEICDYTTHINSNYHKHLRTNKHQKKVLQNDRPAFRGRSPRRKFGPFGPNLRIINNL